MSTFRSLAASLAIVLLGPLTPLPGAEPKAPVTPTARPGDRPTWNGSRPRFVPPVDAPIADPFRAPSGPFGPGNRGIEYATAPGTPVRAIGDGVVAFAGQVAGRGVVSIDHPSGLRSTYTGLGDIFVRSGQSVAQGDRWVARSPACTWAFLTDVATWTPPPSLAGLPPCSWSEWDGGAVIETNCDQRSIRR